MPKIIDHEAVFVYAVNRAYWFGEVRRKEIQRELGLCHNVASHLVGRLRAEGILEPRGKSFVLAPGAETLQFFKERLSIPSCFESMPQAAVALGDPAAWSLDANLHIARPEVLRSLVEALRAFQSIEIVHVSMAANATAIKRTVEPIEFIRKDGVWCVLAHCHLNQGQVLFELSSIIRCAKRQRARIREIPPSVRGKHVCVRANIKSVEGNFEPHPLLTEDQKLVVEFKFGMHHQRLKLTLEPHRMTQFRAMHVAAGPLDRPEGKLLIERK